MKQFLALILALIIGNPVCCCAFGMGSGNAGGSAPHSCCSAPVGSSEDAPEEPESCSCFLEKEKVTHEVTKVPQGVELKQLDGPQADHEEFAALVDLPVAVQAVSKWPPGAVAVLPLGERLATHCSYLL